MQFVSPVIVTLKSNPALGEGIVVGGETYFDMAKDDQGNIQRDAGGGPIMVKKRDVFVFWPADPSELFIHQLGDLVPVEVVAVRNYDQMKEEVIDAIMEELDGEDAEEDDKDGSPEQVNASEPANQNQ